MFSLINHLDSSGYTGSVSFLDAVLQVVDRLRTVNPGLTYGKCLTSLIYIYVYNV